MLFSSQLNPQRRRRLLSVIALGIPWLAAVAVLGAIEYAKMEGMSRGLSEVWAAIHRPLALVYVKHDSPAGDLDGFEYAPPNVADVPDVVLAGDDGQPVLYAFSGDADSLMQRTARSAAVHSFRAGEQAFSVIDGSLLFDRAELSRGQQELHLAERLACGEDEQADDQRIGEEVAAAIEASRRRYESRQSRWGTFDGSVNLQLSTRPGASTSTTSSCGAD